MGHFCKWYLTLSFLHSQCAMTALNDVRQYLSVEGGQVAVSYFELLKKSKLIPTFCLKDCLTSAMLPSSSAPPHPPPNLGLWCHKHNQRETRDHRQVCRTEWFQGLSPKLNNEIMIFLFNFVLAHIKSKMLSCLCRCSLWNLCVKIQMSLHRI